MDKHLEDNPNNPERENDIFLSKNDISKKKKNFQGFKTIEQIPDNGAHEAFGAEIDEHAETENSDSVENVLSDEEIDRLKLEQVRAEIKFHQGEGVASIGPDVGGRWIHDVEEDFGKVDLDPVSVNPGVDSMNPEKLVKSEDGVRKNMKSYKKKAEGKDNLKTIPKNKVERAIRGFLRKMLKRA